MQVKVFESDNMADALKKVKAAFGPEAVILSTRTVRKGGVGFLGKPRLEITAAIDSKEPPGGKIDAPLRPATYTATPPGTAGQDNLLYDNIWLKRKVIDPLAKQVKDLTDKLEMADLLSIKGEIDTLNGLVHGVMTRVSEKHERPGGDDAAFNQQADSSSDFVISQGRLPSASPVMAKLAALGIDDKAAETVIRMGRETSSARRHDADQDLEGFLCDSISKLIRVTAPVKPVGAVPRQLALIGPTGVGKTTTIAKLAAHFLINHGKKVVLVTIDTYRIAAVEQLKVYGDIMGVPVEVVMAPGQMEEVLSRHVDKDLILIDTAGRSPRDDVSIKELAEFLPPDADRENHLVLSAVTREHELYETIRRFACFTPQGLIVTKIDECENHGVLLNMHIRHDYPFSYLTSGQRVPEDLLPAEPDKIAALITARHTAGFPASPVMADRPSINGATA